MADGSAFGWHGDQTYLKLLPANVSTDVYYTVPMLTANWAYALQNTGASKFWWTVAIPRGMKATHFRVNSNVTKTVTLYECEIGDNTTATSKGSGNTNTEIDITDVNYSATNYLTIVVAFDAVNQQLWGGYVKIAPI